MSPSRTVLPRSLTDNQFFTLFARGPVLIVLTAVLFGYFAILSLLAPAVATER